MRWNGASLCVELLWGIKWHAPGERCVWLICKYTLLKRSTMVHHEYFYCTFGTIVLFHLFSLTSYTRYCGGKHMVPAMHYTSVPLTYRVQKALALRTFRRNSCLSVHLSLVIPASCALASYQRAAWMLFANSNPISFQLAFHSRCYMFFRSTYLCLPDSNAIKHNIFFSPDKIALVDVIRE